MNYIIKVKTHRDEIEVRLVAINADDALDRFKLLTKEFIVEEIYPESETGTQLQDSLSPDFTKLNKVGLEAEPYIPDSIRNELLLTLTKLFIDYIKPQATKYKCHRDFLKNLNKLDKLLNDNL